MVDRRSPQLTRRDPAGQVSGDQRLHGFVGDPARGMTAACGAGTLVTAAGHAFDPAVEGPVCEDCATNVRRYERWRMQGQPERRSAGPGSAEASGT